MGHHWSLGRRCRWWCGATLGRRSACPLGDDRLRSGSRDTGPGTGGPLEHVDRNTRLICKLLKELVHQVISPRLQLAEAGYVGSE